MRSFPLAVRPIAAFLLAAALLPASVVAQNAAGAAAPRTDEQKQYRYAMEDTDQKIAAEIKAHSELVKNLEYLTTNIGPRLTGSKNMQAASDWTLKRFRDYGIDAHLESFTIPHGYARGIDSAAITSPVQHIVPIHAGGWSKPTSGEMTGKVVVIDSDADPSTWKGKLKGAIVMMAKPADIPTEEAENAYDAVVTPFHGVPPHSGNGVNPYSSRMRIYQQLTQEGVGVLLLDSGKTDNLFNMGGIGRGYQESTFPAGFIAHEDYALIYRLAKTGPVNMTVNLTGKITPDAQPAAITVGEIKGSQFPDERVIIGGHLDSWDLGQGALDNGTGAMAVLEAARTLKALGLKPKRTITFILFVGEEQGSIGAHKFIENHAAEVPKIDAVLVHDTGTGKVLSIALENLYETATPMAEIYQPILEVFDLQPLSTRYFGQSDHIPFYDKGVPAYFCIQSPAHYREAHHSQTDTFDKVIPDEINQGAGVLASWAWNVSDYPKPLPHHAERERDMP